MIITSPLERPSERTAQRARKFESWPTSSPATGLDAAALTAAVDGGQWLGKAACADSSAGARG